MNINHGYYISLTDDYKQRQLFSASTGNFDDADFIVLWDLVGKRILSELKNAKEKDLTSGYKMGFRIEASKLD